jgi:hypothetical protein
VSVQSALVTTVAATFSSCADALTLTATTNISAAAKTLIFFIRNETFEFKKRLKKMSFS